MRAVVQRVSEARVRVGDRTIPIPDWLKATFGLALPIMANVAEIVRGAVQSIPTAQWDAARSLGLLSSPAPTADAAGAPESFGSLTLRTVTPLSRMRSRISTTSVFPGCLIMSLYNSTGPSGRLPPARRICDPRMGATSP